MPTAPRSYLIENLYAVALRLVAELSPKVQVLCKYSPEFYQALLPIAATEVINRDFCTARCRMNKLPAPGVNADMIDAAATGAEED